MALEKSGIPEYQIGDVVEVWIKSLGDNIFSGQIIDVDNSDGLPYYVRITPHLRLWFAPCEEVNQEYYIIRKL